MLLAVAGFAIVALGRAPVVIIAGFMIANIGVFTALSIVWTLPQSYLSKEIAPGAIGVISMMGTIANFSIPTTMGYLRDLTHGFTSRDSWLCPRHLSWVRRLS